jgi:dGTP triphosphohydrolase
MVIEKKRTELLTLITSLDDKTRRVMHNSKDSLDRDIKTVEDKVHTAYSNSVASLHDPQGHASHVANFNNLVQERQRLLARVSAYDKESKQEYVDLNRSTIAARLMIERGSPEEIISLHKKLIGDISKSDGNNNNN